MKHISKQSKHRQSLYSIEFGGSSSDTIRHGGHSMALGLGDPRGDQDGGGELSPKPMTPRRVKRRSVMARGTQGRQSSGGGSSSRRSHHGSSGTLRSKHGHSGHGGADSSSGSYVRSSTRSSRRKYHQNPVTKIIDQQLQHQQLQQQPHLGSFHRQQDKLSLTASNLQSLNDDIVNNTNVSGSQLGSLGKSNRHYYHSYRKNIPLDPIYYNTNGQGAVLEEPGSPTLPPPPPLPAPVAAASSSILQAAGGGHYNPSYQHSTTHLNDVGHAPDEMYNNRPPSVRSSYSNFHGSRPLSTAYGNAAGENVFAGLTGASASPPQAPCTPPLYQQHPMHMQQQQQQHYLPPPPMDPAPAYVSAMSFSKRTASRESIRSMAFLNNGPPAYNLNYHTPPDSETTM